MHATPIAAMTKPVRCNRCGNIYDLGKVTIAHRYTDCTTWRTPCCLDHAPRL